MQMHIAMDCSPSRSTIEPSGQGRGLAVESRQLLAIVIDRIVIISVNPAIVLC